MITSRHLLVVTAMALTAAPTFAQAGGAAPPDPIPAVGTPAPIKCVRTRDIDSTDVRSDSVIDFHMRGKAIYRNTLPNRCGGLGFARAFSYNTHTSELCSIDIITVLQTGGGMHRGASCVLGLFVPISKEAAKAKVEGK